jgi:hypothetical protein
VVLGWGWVEDWGVVGELGWKLVVEMVGWKGGCWAVGG